MKARCKRKRSKERRRRGERKRGKRLLSRERDLSDLVCDLSFEYVDLIVRHKGRQLEKKGKEGRGLFYLPRAQIFLPTSRLGA